jgi:hypothetical protein
MWNARTPFPADTVQAIKCLYNKHRDEKILDLKATMLSLPNAWPNGNVRRPAHR